MSYRAATYGLDRFGIETGPAHIQCDKCGFRMILNFPGVPPKWFMDLKPPPRWKGGRNPDDTRWDHCPDCKEQKRK